MDWAVEKQVVRDRAEAVYLDGAHATPDLVLEIMTKVSVPKYDNRALVLFDPLLALQLRQLGVVDVTLYLPTINDRMLPWFRQVGVKVISDLDDDMKKFTLGLLNPPYKGKAALHQQFFNRTLDLIEDGGQIVCIQPATPYINKKERKKRPEQQMIENIKTHTTNVKMLSGKKAFPTANILSNLAVTHVVKDNSNSGTVDFIEYTSGETYDDLQIEGITRTEMDPHVFISLKHKVEQYISEYGSLQDIVSEDESEYKYSLAKIRGNAGSDDFYTFVPVCDSYERSDRDYGIKVDNEKQFRNAGLYLKSHVARFCLSILKFTANSHMGELRGVPLVNFNYKWDDESLCELFKFTKAEYKEILRVIPDYY